MRGKIFGEAAPFARFRSMTDRGMLSNRAVSGSCAKTVPPASRTAAAPNVPSVPVPDRMTAIAASF